MEVILDYRVKSCLIGLDMDKYIPLFEQFGVTMKIFISLNEDDLKTMGIEDDNDRDLLLKYCEKFRKTDQKDTDQKDVISDLQLEDVREAIKNIDSHLYTIDMSVSYILEGFRDGQGDLMDRSVDETSLTKITEKTNNHIEEICDEFDNLIKDLLKDNDKRRRRSSRTLIVLPICVAAVAIAVYCYKVK